MAPASYAVNTGSLAIPAGTVAGNPLWIDGITTPFGSAPPDFDAFTINPELSVPAYLQVDWPSGTTAPFAAATDAELTINLANANLKTAVIRIGSESIDLTAPATVTPLIVPQAPPAATAGLPPVFLPLFAIGGLTAADTTTIAVYNTFATFVAKLPTAIVCGDSGPALRGHGTVQPRQQYLYCFQNRPRELNYLPIMGKLTLRLGLFWALGAGCLWSPGSRADVQAADAEPPVRPRICLVLSGGGARGMAHIGVLKVLDDLKIPIDCIAGTSMGAIVGGLYASGMTALEIEATMRSLDWQEAFRDAPPRRDLAFRRKQDDRNFLVRLPLGLKHGQILLPKGFIQGQKLQETLRQLTLPFSNSTDFDLLPTPFRAVATDLETGKAVLMEKGDLAIAMRASMSAPGVFAPVELNGRLLVDGGLAENLPINVARAMHADVLIVSDVSFPLLPRAAARFRAVDIESDAGDPGAQRFRSPARQSRPARYLDRAEPGHGGRDGFHRPGEHHCRRRGGGTRGDGCALGLRRRRFRLSRVPGAARHA